MSLTASKGLRDDLCSLLVLIGKLMPRGRKGPAEGLKTAEMQSYTLSSFPFFPKVPHYVLDWTGLGDVGYSKQQCLGRKSLRVAESLKSNLTSPPKGN